MTISVRHRFSYRSLFGVKKLPLSSWRMPLRYLMLLNQDVALVRSGDLGPRLFLNSCKNHWLYCRSSEHLNKDWLQH